MINFKTYEYQSINFQERNRIERAEREAERAEREIEEAARGIAPTTPHEERIVEERLLNGKFESCFILENLSS